MHTRNILLGLLFVGFLSESSFAQSSAVFQSLLYPRSITSSAMGEQGVASRSALDAMQYNPANLAYANGVSLSFFRNPWNILGFVSLPLTTLSLTGKIGNSGSLGIEYMNHDYGETTISTGGGPEGVSMHTYERSVAGGYALSLTNQIALGVQLRYSWRNWPNWGNPLQPILIDKFLFGAGVSYKPEIFSDRLVAGLSLMNFGTRVKYSFQTTSNGETSEVVRYASPPAQLNLGFQGLAITNDFFDVSAAISVTKPFDKGTGAPVYEGQSSFKSLFDDWDDFPNDMTAHIGLGFLWHPIHLGSGISFFQEMYVGYFSTGPNDLYQSFYIHGVKIGLKGYGVQATAGYAGWWHNNNAAPFIPWYLPWETFQFTLGIDMNLVGEKKKAPVVERLFSGTILSGGYAYGIPVGRMKETISGGGKISYLKNHGWSVEADFYMNKYSAILASFRYARMDVNAVPIYIYPMWNFDFGIETVSFESGFRYHPIEVFHPFFVQVSLGVIRLNPVYERTYPRYMYKSYDEVALGCVVPVMEDVILKPKVGLKTLFMEVGSLGRIGGYNQFEFGVNVGYRL